jgi:hypothetical protein
MAIETRSASKRKVIEALKYARMGWGEYIVLKFDQVVVTAFKIIFSNFLLILLLVTATILVQYINAATDYFEVAAAYLQQREPVLSNPPKDVALADFLHL